MRPHLYVRNWQESPLSLRERARVRVKTPTLLVYAYPPRICSWTRSLNPCGAPDAAVERSMSIVVLSVSTNAVHGPHRSRCDLILDDSPELRSPSMKSEDAALTSPQSSSRPLNKLTSREIILL